MSYPTSEDIAAVPNYTSAEMLRFYKGQMLRIARDGDSYSIAGRSGQEASQYIEAQIKFWQDRVDQEAAIAGTAGTVGGGNVLARVTKG